MLLLLTQAENCRRLVKLKAVESATNRKSSLKQNKQQLNPRRLARVKRWDMKLVGSERIFVSALHTKNINPTLIPRPENQNDKP